MTLNQPFLIGNITVEPRAHVVVVSGVRTPVEPLVMRILLRLAEEPDGVLSRDTLIESIWPGEECDDSSLYRAIWGLRRVLGDDSGEPRYIETIPRVGYRLIPAVTPITPSIAVSGDGHGGVATGGGAEIDSGARRPERLPRRGTPARTIWNLKAAVVSLTLLVFALSMALVGVLAGQSTISETIEVYRTADGVDSVVVGVEPLANRLP